MQTQASSSPVSSAPSASPSTGGGDASQGFDVSEAIQEARRARAEGHQLKSAFDKQSSELKSTRETVDKIRDVFAPKQEAAPDPVADLEEQMDYYLEQAMEAKSRGQPIPLTTNLALRFFQSQIENHKTQQALQAEIQRLKGGVDHATDPETPVNNMAYAHMENFLQQSLDSMYGVDEHSTGVKRNVYQGVVNMLQADLKELQKKAPHVWDQVRRNPQQLQQIVQKAVARLVPPKARSIIEQEQLQNTPMKEGELWAAFREAGEIKDPARRLEVRKAIRQDILDMQLNRNKRRR